MDDPNERGIKSLANALRLSAMASDLTPADMEEGGWFQEQCEVALRSAFEIGAGQRAWNAALVKRN